MMLPVLQELYAEARKRVEVYCDEFHAHSALGGCLRGPADAIAICKFAEYVLALEGAASAFATRVAALKERGAWC